MVRDMRPALFLADLEAVPASLEALAAELTGRDPFAGLPGGTRRVLLLGMGSSRFAADVAARRLRARGFDAVAELASADPLPPAGPGTLVVAISASGKTAETIAAAERYRGTEPLVAMTNVPDSPLAEMADEIVALRAGTEASGVACRTFRHTGLLLHALEDRLTGDRSDVAALCRRAADSTRDLLDRRREWLPAASAALDGPDGVAVIAPAERLSSAEQGALMFREGPRRPATGSETGDWAHVEVYLTLTRDYRTLLFSGSRWDANALDWLRRRSATIVGVGSSVDGAAATVRYRGDDDPRLSLHVEVLVAELVAATWWSERDPEATA
jgi:fructoselysine-6-P-deglycase FrlB-like protein